MKIKKTQKEMQVLIGQPKVYPETLIQEMKKFFNQNLSVKKVYLACIQYPEPNISPKLIVGIKNIENSLAPIVLDLENYLSSKKIKLMEIDFVDADHEPFNNYFSKIKPFYSKSEEISSIRMI